MRSLNYFIVYFNRCRARASGSLSYYEDGSPMRRIEGGGNPRIQECVVECRVATRTVSETRRAARFRKYFRSRSGQLGNLRSPQLTGPARERDRHAQYDRARQRRRAAQTRPPPLYIFSCSASVVLTAYPFYRDTELIRFY